MVAGIDLNEDSGVMFGIPAMRAGHASVVKRSGVLHGQISGLTFAPASGQECDSSDDERKCDWRRILVTDSVERGQ